MSSWQEAAERTRRFARGSSAMPTVAVVLTLASLVEASIDADVNDRAVAMFVAMAATVPLAAAVRFPIPAALITTAAVFAMLAETAPMTGAAVVAELIALYLVASRTGRLVEVLFAIPFVVNAMFPIGGPDTSDTALVAMVAAVAALAIGDARRLRRVAIVERDASRQRAAESQRKQTVMEERARIARELHDVVAHHVSMIAVQAETAGLTTPDVPEEGRRRFGDIAESARDALGEMRQLLGVLREDGGAERRPQPGLDRLQELIEDARATGTPVRLTLRGPVAPLAPSVDLTAYRVVQEALTNARRHAPGATVEVGLDYGATTVRLRIRDDGPGPAPGWSDGNGLTGMRERTGTVGGTVRAGPAEGGGFQVDAELPIEGTPSDGPDAQDGFTG